MPPEESNGRFSSVPLSEFTVTLMLQIKTNRLASWSPPCKSESHHIRNENPFTEACTSLSHTPAHCWQLDRLTSTAARSHVSQISLLINCRLETADIQFIVLRFLRSCSTFTRMIYSHGDFFYLTAPVPGNCHINYMRDPREIPS